MRNVGIIGADGRWGGTLANLSQFGGNNTIGCCLPEGLKRIERDRTIPFTNRTIKIDKNIAFTSEPDGLESCDIVYIAVPGTQLSLCWKQWGPYIKGITVVAVKSIVFEEGELRLPLSCVNSSEAVYLTCGAFADVADKMNPSPSIGCVYGRPDLTRKIQEAIPKEYLRLYTARDVTGAQIGSALKNIIALAAGIATGLGFGSVMTISALASRGLNEIMKFAIQYGGREYTFFGRNSIEADLFGTCFSKDSHNRQAGEALAAGKSIEEIFMEIGTVEGIQSALVLDKLPSIGDMPIANAVINILNGNNPRQEAVKILDRPLS